MVLSYSADYSDRFRTRPGRMTDNTDWPIGTLDPIDCHTESHTDSMEIVMSFPKPAAIEVCVYNNSIRP